MGIAKCCHGEEHPLFFKWLASVLVLPPLSRDTFLPLLRGTNAGSVAAAVATCELLESSSCVHFAREVMSEEGESFVMSECVALCRVKWSIFVTVDPFVVMCAVHVVFAVGATTIEKEVHSPFFTDDDLPRSSDASGNTTQLSNCEFRFAARPYGSWRAHQISWVLARTPQHAGLRCLAPAFQPVVVPLSLRSCRCLVAVASSPRLPTCALWSPWFCVCVCVCLRLPVCSVFLFVKVCGRCRTHPHGVDKVCLSLNVQESAPTAD